MPCCTPVGTDIGELQERCRVGLGVWRRQTLIVACQLDHQHAAVGKELDGGRQIEAGRQDLVLEVPAGIGYVDGHRRRHAVLPFVSRASAVSVCVPFRPSWCPRDAVGRGGVLDPRALLSKKNCTPATPTLSAALAVTVTVPETEVPPVGALMVAVGGGTVSPPVATCALKIATCMTHAAERLSGAVAL